METPALPVQTSRIHSIDILRGIIMVIMALDHVRDFYSNATFDPLDLSKTSVIFFMTRFITHFCAPTFIFLSGTSAFLSLSKKKTKKEASLFMLSRGLWLLFLEMTIISFGWQVDTGFHTIFAQVIWAIGWSMVIMSVLIFLEPIYVGIIGLILIFGHNAFDGIKSASFGEGKFLWMFLHEQNFYQISSDRGIFFLYPLIPWVGVMAAGYAFGTLFKFGPDKRQALFIKIGLASILLFLILRGLNIYGDPFPWQHQSVWWKNILAVLRVQKYPPSLAYLLITLGVSITALGLLERTDNKVSRIFTVFGRVPMFYYILHIYLIHGSQIIGALLSGVTKQQLEQGGPGKPNPFGFDLWAVYLIWFTVVFILYWPCRWFMKVKQRRKEWWLSYL
ncbi:DUF1624 domain-containing protein [Mucilaginibacter myungsuensis]|uniref:DUF1624 domain-containing protein n=1 Tax=Mucilaginibacter myungsuensis TaxID=649104 RepID=A0A929KU38_9SPHI|nr:heparan-alpha-glucosaminide N-acetyltransferase domain-containing protein [Mucilaginibacter myungsuensis]MBE9661212.1 DUF1624 domain-containing protein [Mucilaginibacter myungsuensis]MDN3597356.1 heparan-alpha-glucosaminide N-acetyltransferase domain-containing protein [Mucilaginibacter myungsuensis]